MRRFFNIVLLIAIMIIINLIIFVSLYIFHLLPIIEKNPCNLNFKTCFFEYSDKIKISDIDEISLEKINGPKLYNNQYVTFNEFADLEIFIRRRDRNAKGIIRIFGNYSSDDNLKKFLETLGLQNQTNDKRINLDAEGIDSSYIEIIDKNEFKMVFISGLPLADLEFNRTSKYQNYFLKINEKNNAIFQKKLKLRYANIFIIILLFNGLILLLKYKFHFSIYEKD